MDSWTIILNYHYHLHTLYTCTHAHDLMPALYLYACVTVPSPEPSERLHISSIRIIGNFISIKILFENYVTPRFIV